MIENHSLNDLRSIKESGNLGDLHRPVFNSAFARDRGFDLTVQELHWTTPLVRVVESISPPLRYRKQVRHFLLGGLSDTQVIAFQSTGLPYQDDGYQPHQSICDNRRNYEQGWDRVIEESKAAGAGYQPLADDAWEAALQPGGYFDDWIQYFKLKNVTTVFFALPTNPKLIDIKNRRDTYQNNSRRFADWAAQHNVAFIDLGIQDSLIHDVDYSDHRHLSACGAEKYSAKLGAAMAECPQVIEALRR